MCNGKKNCGCDGKGTVPTHAYSKRRNCNSHSPCTNYCGSELEYTQLVAIIKKILQCEFKDLNIDINLDIYKMSKEKYDTDPYWHDEINRIYNKMEQCGPDDPELNKVLFMLVQRTDWLKQQLRILADAIADTGWVRDVLDLDQLRLYEPLRANQQVLVKGKGLYWADYGDTTSPDDGKDVIVGVNGVRWKLDGSIGGTGGGVNLAVTTNKPEEKDSVTVPTKYMGSGNVLLTSETHFATFDANGRNWLAPIYDNGPARGGGGGNIGIPPAQDKFLNQAGTRDSDVVLTMTDSQEHVVPLKALIENVVNNMNIGGGGNTGPDKHVSSGSVTNNKLTLVVNHGNAVEIDMQPLVDTIIRQIGNTGYTIKTVDADYTIDQADIDNNTILRANADGDCTISVPVPTGANAIGKTITIRKTNGAVGTYVTLAGTGGATLSPDDALLLRRVGSVATLVYTGNNNWDIFGELP